MTDLRQLVVNAYFAPVHGDCTLYAKCRAHDAILALIDDIIPAESEPVWWADGFDKIQWQTRQAIRNNVLERLRAADLFTEPDRIA